MKKQEEYKEFLNELIEYLKDKNNAYDQAKEYKLKLALRKYESDVYFLSMLDERIIELFSEVEQGIIVDIM